MLSVDVFLACDPMRIALDFLPIKRLVARDAQKGMSKKGLGRYLTPPIPGMGKSGEPDARRVEEGGQRGGLCSPPPATAWLPTEGRHELLSQHGPQLAV